MTAQSHQQTFAAVDLGSNSFHMIIARVLHGQLHVVDRIREPVRLAAGLNHKNHLDAASQKRAIACLQRLGQRIHGFPPDHVRAVGTNTLRTAKNARAFLRTAQRALGHPIEVLPGSEEARLIYLGASHSIADNSERRLVVDIGGGSTECIIGERFEPLLTGSLYMGCVTYSRKFFEEGHITRRGFEEAEVSAQLELQSIEGRYTAMGWEHCVGASGTISSIEAILRQNNWSSDGITAQGLKKLRKQMITAGNVHKLSLPGLSDERAAVLPGGVAILRAIFERFAISTMHTSAGALREGLLYDLLGRVRHEDVRDRTIRRLCERFDVDPAQAARVERTALRLLNSVGKAWDLDNESSRQFLMWGARLHELGLMVSFSGYHKHGAYLIANADAPGFSRDEQQLLAAIIRGHRRKISTDLFKDLPRHHIQLAMRLSVLLRLSTLLHRSRGLHPVPLVQLTANKNHLTLQLAKSWLMAHPLTHTDLMHEKERLEALTLVLSVRQG